MTKVTTCVGPEDDLVTPEGGDCTKPKTTPLNEGVIVDVTCTDKDGKQTISTTFTGDFTTRYHAILKTTFDPPLGAISHMGVNIDGKYLGPDCKAGEAQPETKWLIWDQQHISGEAPHAFAARARGEDASHLHPKLQT